MKRKLFSLAYYMLCLAGFLYQVSLICHEYFKYEVSSSTILSQANDYNLPAISTCFEFPEIFNFTAFNTKYNMNFVYNTSDRETWDDSGVEIQKIATVNDVYEFTPEAENVCKSVNVRNASTFSYEHHNSSQCYENFMIEKFLISTLVCYKINLKITLNEKYTDYNRGNAYFTPNSYGDILFLFFNEEKFAHFDYIINVMHPVNNYPWFEFSLTQLLTRSHNVSIGISALNIFNSKSFSISINKLKYPYITKCQEYNMKGYRDSYHCISECMNKYVPKYFGKASLSYHYFEGENLKVLSREDFASKSFNESYRKILNICEDSCPMNDCHFTATYTSTIGESFTSPGIGISLPDKPSFVINFSITVLFIDTINFIGSAFGVWFGISFLSIHPNKIYIMLKNKKDTSQNNYNASNNIASYSTSYSNEALNEMVRRDHFKLEALSNYMEKNQDEMKKLKRQIREISEKIGTTYNMY